MLPISRTLLGMTALLSLLSCRTQEKTYALTAEDDLTMRKEADAFCATCRPVFNAVRHRP